MRQPRYQMVGGKLMWWWSVFCNHGNGCTCTDDGGDRLQMVTVWRGSGIVSDQKKLSLPVPVGMWAQFLFCCATEGNAIGQPEPPGCMLYPEGGEFSVAG